MSALKKPVAALIGVMAVLLAGLFFAVSPAGAYPSGTPATISVSDATPNAGAKDTVSGSGYEPGEDVALDFHSVVTSLGAVTADSSGAFTTTVTIPAGASGSHEIVGTGLSSGALASVALEVNGSSSGGGTVTGIPSGGSSGGVAYGGVAVIGIGALGVVLLVGGGLLLMAGKRRKVSI